jgi:hypothetical protein
MKWGQSMSIFVVTPKSRLLTPITPIPLPSSQRKWRHPQYPMDDYCVHVVSKHLQSHPVMSPWTRYRHTSLILKLSWVNLFGGLALFLAWATRPKRLWRGLLWAGTLAQAKKHCFPVSNGLCWFEHQVYSIDSIDPFFNPMGRSINQNSTR